MIHLPSDEVNHRSRQPKTLGVEFPVRCSNAPSPSAQGPSRAERYKMVGLGGPQSAKRWSRREMEASMLFVVMGKPKAASTGKRSEEHTSELQSRQYLVCRLLLEKKKKKINRIITTL